MVYFITVVVGNCKNTLYTPSYKIVNLVNKELNGKYPLVNASLIRCYFGEYFREKYGAFYDKVPDGRKKGLRQKFITGFIHLGERTVQK